MSNSTSNFGWFSGGKSNTPKAGIDFHYEHGVLKFYDSRQTKLQKWSYECDLSNPNKLNEQQTALELTWKWQVKMFWIQIAILCTGPAMDANGTVFLIFFFKLRPIVHKTAFNCQIAMHTDMWKKTFRLTNFSFDKTFRLTLTFKNFVMWARLVAELITFYNYKPEDRMTQSVGERSSHTVFL